MEIFKTNIKNLSKNKFYLILFGLAVIIFATVLIYAYLEFSGTKISFAPNGEQKCGIENCHGLDITCGPNIPNVCTEIWMIGDGCREYAKCEIINGKCQLVQNKKFEDCKSCVEKCSEDFSNDPINLSQCAYKCAEAEKETCKDLCGDGICQEIVCMAIGCPCAETAKTCPEDCKEEETLSADLNCDGNVNLTDSAILMSFWGQDPSGAVSCQSPDINQDGKVNLADSAIMMSQWATGQEIIDCGEDYDCLYQQISNGNSAKVIITEERFNT